MKQPETVTVNYNDLVMAVAKEFAKAADPLELPVTVTPKHLNKAKRVIWPLLDDTTHTALVMR